MIFASKVTKKSQMEEMASLMIRKYELCKVSFLIRLIILITMCKLWPKSNQLVTEICSVVPQALLEIYQMVMATFYTQAFCLIKHISQDLEYTMLSGASEI